MDLNTVWTQTRHLRVVLRIPFAQEQPITRYGVPFGDVVFPDLMPDSGPFRRDEMEREAWLRIREVQHWLDVSSPGYGATLAASTRVVDLEPPVVNVVVARTSSGRQSVQIVDGERLPVPRMPLGPIQIQVALSPHSGDWTTARAFRRGWELNTPLLPVVVADPSSPKRLPPSQSFLALDPASLVVTGFKREADGRMLLRAYDAVGRSAEGSLRLVRPPKRMRVANPLGEPGEAVEGALRVGVREIATWVFET